MFCHRCSMKWTIDICFNDGDHNSRALFKNLDAIRPFLHPNSILVLDDIHWSSDMEYAWKQIQGDDFYRQTIDFYRFGVVFLRREQEQQNFVLRY